jgi:hypothetical protein
MGFLDKVKDAAGKATEQAKSVAAAGKDKYDETRLQKKANDLYEEIGKLIVASKRGQGPTDVDAQIDAKIGEISEIEQQIEASHAAAAAAGANATASASESTAAATPPPPQNVPTAPPGPPA